MSNSLEFDPNKGFVALPAAIFDMEMSPAAFRTLSELCRMANKEGFCWPSLEQLGKRMKRSKAAISGYLKELRDLGLLETINQKMANGYNYRLKFLVTFWETWRKSLSRKSSKPTPQESERSVQQDERVDKSTKTNNNKNHSPAPPTAVQKIVSEIYLEWVECTRGAPFRKFTHPPSAKLVSQSKQALENRQASAPALNISTDIKPSLKDLWGKLSVRIDIEVLAIQVNELGKYAWTETTFQQLLKDINELWQSHWKRPPSPDQFSKLVKEARNKHPYESHLNLIQMHMENWKSTK